MTRTGSRLTLMLATAFLGVIFLTGCKSTGDLILDLGPEDVFYISPANQDGVQDELALRAEVIPASRSVIQRYRVDIVDTGENPVRTYEEMAPKGGFFWQERRRSVDPPDIVIWDGATEDGTWARDGRYRVAFEVSDNRGRTERLDNIIVVVDNQLPYVEPAVSFPWFSPNNDGRLDTLTISQNRSSIEKEWTGRILDENGSTVRTWTWEGAALSVEWDGTNDGGAPTVPGSYTYEIAATDLAGNSARFAVPEFGLDTEARSAAVTASASWFSPNDDTIQDTVEFGVSLSNRPTIVSVDMTVVNARGRVVRVLPISADTSEVAFDGRGDDGRVLPDGGYRAVVSAEYRNGDAVSTAGPLVSLDTVPPRVAVATDYRLFSPDADGRRDTITFRRSSEYDGGGVSEIVARDGSAIRRHEWSGAPRDLEWDGTDDTFKLVPDGIYSYRVTSTDPAGNRAERWSIRFDSTRGRHR